MVCLVNGILAPIPRYPDRHIARETEQPLYSPDASEQCPDHPTSAHLTRTGQCLACWRAGQTATLCNGRPLGIAIAGTDDRHAHGPHPVDEVAR